MLWSRGSCLYRYVDPAAVKSDAGVLGQFDGAFGGTVEDVEVDEVAALGMRPVGNLRVAEPVVEDVENQLELGREQLTVLGHVGAHAVGVAEEPDAAAG